MWCLQLVTCAVRDLRQAWNLGLPQDYAPGNWPCLQSINLNLLWEPYLCSKDLRVHWVFLAPVICIWHAGIYIICGLQNSQGCCLYKMALKKKIFRIKKRKLLVCDKILISTGKLCETWQTHISPLWIFWVVLCITFYKISNH